LEGLQRLAQNSTTIVAIGGILSTISYAVWTIRGLQSKIEVLEEHLKTVEVGLDEKIKTTNEKINTAKVGLNEKINGLDEKINTAKVEAIKESTENYLKYNHSEEFNSLRKSNGRAS
jgi:hypothetical protein